MTTSFFLPQLPLLKLLSAWSTRTYKYISKLISVHLSIAFHIAICSQHFIPGFSTNPLQVLLLPLHYFFCLVKSSFIPIFLKSNSFQNFAFISVFLYFLYIISYIPLFQSVLRSFPQRQVLTAMSVWVQTGNRCTTH